MSHVLWFSADVIVLSFLLLFLLFLFVDVLLGFVLFVERCSVFLFLKLNFSLEDPVFDI
jgi:hypothetical protein